MKRRTPFAPVKPVVGSKAKKTGPEPWRPWVAVGAPQHPAHRLKK